MTRRVKMEEQMVNRLREDIFKMVLKIKSVKVLEMLYYEIMELYIDE